MFDAIARILREAKMLGLFVDTNAHNIVVGWISDVMTSNKVEGFDAKNFESIAGAIEIVTTDELAKLLAPVDDYDETHAEVMTEILRDCD